MQDHNEGDTENSNAEFFILHIPIDSNNKKGENDLATMCSASRFTTQSEMEKKKEKKKERQLYTKTQRNGNA